jgi:hypothetical protein
MAYRAPYRTCPLALADLGPPTSLTLIFDYTDTENQRCIITPAEHSLRIITRLKDGNCTLASIAKAVYGDESYHPRVRKEICDFFLNVVSASYANMSFEHQLLLCLAFDALDWQAVHEFHALIRTYVRNMCVNAVNAGRNELACAAHLYRLQIIILQQNNGTTPPTPTPTTLYTVTDNVFQHAVPVQYETTSSVPGCCARAEPIMLLFEFRRSPEANTDPGGHYSLLKFTPNPAIRVPGRGAMGAAAGRPAAPAVVAAAKPAGSAVVGNNGRLLQNRREKHKQLALIAAIMAQTPHGGTRSASLQQQLDACRAILSRAQEVIHECERISEVHDSTARQWSQGRRNADAGSFQPSTHDADARADAAAARAAAASARGTGVAVAAAARAARVATASAAESIAVLTADIDRRNTQIQQTVAGSAARAQDITRSHIMCLNQRTVLWQQLATIEIRMLQNGNTSVSQDEMRVLQDRITVNDDAIIAHQNMPATDIRRLAEMRARVRTQETTLRALQSPH